MSTTTFRTYWMLLFIVQTIEHSSPIPKKDKLSLFQSDLAQGGLSNMCA